MKYDSYMFFSTWIFVWYILYMFSLIRYNPFFTLCIASIFTVMVIIFQIKSPNILTYIILNIITKFIPLLTLASDISYENIMFGILLFYVYCIYIIIMYKISPFTILRDIALFDIW